MFIIYIYIYIIYSTINMANYNTLFIAYRLHTYIQCVYLQLYLSIGSVYNTIQVQYKYIMFFVIFLFCFCLFKPHTYKLN